MSSRAPSINPTSSSSCPVESSTRNPWDALFASATRPRQLPVTSFLTTTTTTQQEHNYPATGGYTILIQHSITSKSQRQWAFDTTMNVTADHSRPKVSSLSNSMAAMSVAKSITASPASKGEWFGMSGPFMVKQAFEELCNRCDGAVVFVSLLGATGVVDFDNLENVNVPDDIHRDHGDGNIREESGSTFSEEEIVIRRSIMMGKFRRNGAWVDLSSNPFGWDSQQRNEDSDTFRISSTINHLYAVAQSIRQAAANVKSRRGDHSNAALSIHSLQPIPIIFDSLTPLLHLHGAHNVSLLFQSLKQVIPSQLSTKPLLLSPIVAPVLHESIRPADHRLLEDVSDAIMSIHLKDVSNPHHASTHLVATAVLDLVRRGGGGSNALGGKLMRHCIPLRVMKTSKTKYFTTNGQRVRVGNSLRDRFYWILDHDEVSSTGEVKRSQPPKLPPHPIEGNGSAGNSTGNAANNRPRIYIDENDPEFDDFDEEDPDDDLDL